MKTIITVKKNKTHKNCMRLFTVCYIACVIALFLFSKSMYPYDWALFCICIVLGLPMFILLLYYETWQISFYHNSICFKLLLSCRYYSYSQIVDVVSSRSYTDHDCLQLHFRNGQKLVFRMKDENAYQAKKRIIAYHSIRIRG